SVVHTTTRTFAVTVTSLNDAPTINAIPHPAPINEDATTQTVSLSRIPPAYPTPRSPDLLASSSNTGIVPNPTVNYTSANSTGTLTYAPVADANGTVTITVTVDDGGLVNNTIQRTFTVVVNSVNDAPTITAISNPPPILAD